MKLYLKVVYANKQTKELRTQYFETNVKNKNFDYLQGIELDKIAFDNVKSNEDVMSWKLVEKVNA